MSWDTNSAGFKYPVTKMQFLVTIGGVPGSLSFTEVTGVDASVDVIEYRQGNSTYLSLNKLPGLVHHGNITLKFGTVIDVQSNEVYKWMMDCVADQRANFERKQVIIDLIDSNNASAGAGSDLTAAVGTTVQWTLNDAWVTKLSIPDLDAKGNDVAISSCEIAYEYMS